MSNDLTKELLALEPDKLLQHEKVVGAAEGLGIKTTHVQGLGKYPMAWTKIILGSLADVAFEMRNACMKQKFGNWHGRMRFIASGMWPADYDCWIIGYSQPKHWIIAATLAYWQEKEVNHE